MVSVRRHWLAFTLAALALVYLILLAVIRREPDRGPTEIYFADRITDAHRVLIDRYNRVHEGKVRVVPIDFPNAEFTTNERKEVLARSLRGEGEGIDLLAVDVIWVGRFAKWCEPLEEHFSPEELKRILPDALASCYSDNVLVAVPLDLVQGVLYYREDLVAARPGGADIARSLQRPMTWPAFLGLQKRLQPAGPFYIFPAAEYEGLICIFIEILLGLKEDYFKVHGFDFTTAEARQALGLLVDLVQKHGAAPAIVTSLTEVPSYEYFVRHDGLFLRGWISYDRDFRSAPYDSVREAHLRKAPLPYPAGGRPASVFGGWNLMISRFSTKKEESLEFMRYLLSDSAQELIYAQGGYLPVVTAFYEDPTIRQKYPEVSALRALMQTGVHRPAERDYTKYSRIMAGYFSRAIRGKIPVDEALERTTRDIRIEQALGQLQ